MLNPKKRLLAVVLVLTMILVLPNVVFANKQTFTFANQSGHTVTELYISDFENDVWEQNYVKDSPIKSGDSRVIAFDNISDKRPVHIMVRDDSGGSYNDDVGGLSKNILDMATVITYWYTDNGNGHLKSTEDYSLLK